MKLPDVIPLPWKIGTALALVGALAVAHIWRVHQADQNGFDRATSERAARDAIAIISRVQNNAALSIKQDSINAVLTKVKNEELAPVRSRIAAERVRVGTAICGPAAPAQAEDATGSDGANPPGRLVRSDIDRDIRALKLAVEEDLATGRACQAFGRENGLVP
jgi:prophage endopeptidase